MTLAIFDLDNTLIAGDSDHLWGEFLVERGLVDSQQFKASNDQFYQDYKDGQLDIEAYLRFALQPLTEHAMSNLIDWRSEFLAEKIAPIMLPAAERLLHKHRDQGDTLMIITATNDFITGPIAEQLGVDHLLASRAQMIGNRYTGEIDGVPCFRDGKVQRLYEWLEQHHESLPGSWFYSDSHNDLPLLRKVSNPVAVDPDPVLLREAQTEGWQVISLRGQQI
ncbi:MAG: HAD-IB family hydrolase [Alcanivoracaceae bacterium]|nr:HAD-IB family hydrolase [Alcanivoracaceae bacterium]